MFWLSRSFSDVPSLPILVDVQRLHENGKLILCVSNGTMFVYELSGCGIDSCCSYLNFRYHACFGQEAPWHAGNYRVYIHSKTRMRHDKDTQLKNSLPLLISCCFALLSYTVISFAVELRHVEKLHWCPARIESMRFLFIWSEKSLLSFTLFIW